MNSMHEEPVVGLGRDTVVQSFLAPFKELIDDDDITEIAVNKPGTVWYESRSSWSSTAHKVTDEKIQQLGNAVAVFSSQKWDKGHPLLSAALPGGARIQFVRDPAVEHGNTSFTMRKPIKLARSLDDFSAAGLFREIRPMQASLMPHEQELKDLLAARNYEQFLRRAVTARMNIVVAGATGSGKTTFMKGLVQEIPRSERLITIEDVRELFVPHENTVHLLYSKGGQSSAKTAPKDLLESCLRMKPDRILLAEVRGDECLYFVRNAASGHPGSMTSCHAGSPALAFEQMAIMIQDSPGGSNLTFDVIRRLLTLTIDIIIQFQNVAGRRFISEIYYAPEKKLEAVT
ncbi:P-type DNA transfer ATPase VirB11 [Variovorax ginsengisoli]|uniref:Type IV secretion system protein VirB11 n=1 Tax=Variovorax ginsengisoli TaxID=363844 RepID=A0ABT9SDW3_9BURK|nr:P-type DNA transfer ATPase VirB11 [Variovorax ginsengisoli]MDP9902390.1 type IV secretion system protein VirB11 [Variovorax ginsengisoli]